MNTLRATILVALLLVLSVSAQGSTVYSLNFDHGVTSPSAATYVAGTTEVVPAGIVGIGNGDLTPVSGVTGDPSVLAPQGGQVMKWQLPAGWPNNGEGYRFGSDGTVYKGTSGPVISDSYTIETLINPDYNMTMMGLTFPLSSKSTLLDSTISAGQGFRLYIDQTTQKFVFEPVSGTTTGKAISASMLQHGYWYHIALVVRSGAPRQTELWVNGVMEASGTYPTGSTLSIPGYFKLGSPYAISATGQHFEGEVDALVISNSALDSGHFVLPKPAHAPPAPIYRLNFDHGTLDPVDGVDYMPGTGETIPAWITGVNNHDGGSGYEAIMRDPVILGPQGGQVMQWRLVGGFPGNMEGFRFGSDGSMFTGPLGPVISGSWTIEADINPEYGDTIFGSFPSTSKATLLDSTIAGNGFRLSIDQFAQKMVFEPVSDSSTDRVVSTTLMQQGSWYHVAAIARSDGPRRSELWINGILEATGSYPVASTFTIPGYFKLGSPYDSSVSGQNFQGQLDALAITPAALDDSSFVLHGRQNSLSSCKTASDGTQVTVGGATVVARFIDASGPISFAVENLDRSCGIRVISWVPVNVGDIVSISGVATTISGERVIDATLGSVFIAPTGNPSPPSALGVTNAQSGGGSFGEQDAVVDFAPDVMSSGTNNIGLLTKIWGRATYVNNTGGYDGYFYIDDGSGLLDGSGHTGIKCRPATGYSLPFAGDFASDFVSVTGVMGVQQINGVNARYFWSTSSTTPKAYESSKVLVCFGFFTDILNLDGALSGWKDKNNNSPQFTWVNCPPNAAEGFPSSYDVLLSYGTVVLSDVNHKSLGAAAFEMLCNYVQQGGNLLVTGGLYAFGNGEFGNTRFLQVLPVQISGPFDLKWAGKGQSWNLTAAQTGSTILNGVSFTQTPKVFWHHFVTPMTGAQVVLNAGDKPALILGKYGHGSVAVLTLSPTGEGQTGETQWWEWDGWFPLVRNIFTWLSND